MIKVEKQFDAIYKAMGELQEAAVEAYESPNKDRMVYMLKVGVVYRLLWKLTKMVQKGGWK